MSALGTNIKSHRHEPVTSLPVDFSPAARKTAPPPDDTPIGDVPNLGPASVQLLGVLDISTAGDLRRLGPDLVFRMLRDTRVETSVNLLYAMAAGLEGRHWLDLSPDEREALRRQIED